MESEPHRDIFDENLKRLLETTREKDSGFQTRLLAVVREEVRKERSAIHRRLVFRGLSAAVGIAAVLVIAWSVVSSSPKRVG